MARPAFLVCGRLRGFGTAQYPRALRRYREAVCRGCADAVNARNGGGLRIDNHGLCAWVLGSARVLSSRRTWPARKGSIIWGSTIFFPSSCTLPCLIKRLASARDFAIAKAPA